MKLGTKVAIAVATPAIALAATGCGGGGYYPQATYCVNQMTGMVEPPQYCQVGSGYYNPMLYDFWVGSTYGHVYRPGVVISHRYYVSGRKVNPSSATARRAAGIPASGTVRNGVTSKSPTPAKAQTAPGGSYNKSNTTKVKTPSFGGSYTKRSTTSTRSSFGSSSGSSSRSSFGSSSSGRSRR